MPKEREVLLTAKHFECVENIRNIDVIITPLRIT